MDHDLDGKQYAQLDLPLAKMAAAGEIHNQ